MTHRLQGHNAVITGGHRGLGLAVAKRFVAEGAGVLLVGRNRQKVDMAVADLLRVTPAASVFGLPADVTDDGSPDKIIARGIDNFGAPPSLLVNCAGVFIWRAMLDVSSEDWQRTLATHLTAPFLMTQAFARALRDQAPDAAASAAVVNIGSVHGPVGDGNAVPQCAAKAGLLGLTRSAAEALRPLGIRVNALNAGQIEPSTPDTISEGLDQKITQGDLASAVLYLASAESRGITGTVLDAYGITRPVIATG